jgi:sporulation protein YlmC with PRC-barrel domain
MTDDMNRIVPLDELDDFKVADGDPDVRGWDVVTADGRRIGEVDNLLIDTGAMKVRYLDIDLDDEALELEGERHVLVPIGYARLDDDDDRVIVDELQASQLRGLPEYTHGPLTRDYETTLRRSLDPGSVGPTGGAPDTGRTITGASEGGQDDFYEDRLFSDARFSRRGR